MFDARTLLCAMMICMPATVFAAGTEDAADTTEPPATTETTTECKEGEVFDEEEKKCLKAEDSSLNDDQRFRAVRELAYAGRPEEALLILATMTEGDTDRVLTYKGFANRKAGRLEEGLAFYNQALALNPDNILTRSYMGQMFVEMGEIDAAKLQLDEIRARGGEGTWAEASLASAIATGKTMNY